MTPASQKAVEPTIEIENLKTYFFTRSGVVKSVDGVSYSVAPGEILGIVGESGSGKTVTGMSIMGLVEKPGRIVEGSIRFKGEEIANASERRLRQLRGGAISMVFQDATTALNPVLRVDTQMVETLRAHKKISRREALKTAEEMLARVGIPTPEKRLKSYPHEFSGGMRQRVSIAMALLNDPDLIIADEPTTALDVTVQAQVLLETQKLCREKGTSLIWVTHDLTVVAGLADKVCVMYAGRIVESGSVDDILDNPQHPYTIGLIGSIPSSNTRGRKLQQIEGTTPSLLNIKPGCAFRERCWRATSACQEEPPESSFGPGRTVRCFHPCLDGEQYESAGLNA